MLKICKWLLISLPVILNAGFFDWTDPLSAKAQRAQNALEGFDAIVDQALKDYQVPGIAIAVVTDGHVIYSKGFGHRNIELKLPVTENTLFAIGSCTKAFTTFAMGTLVEEGALEWDQQVIDILPEFRLWDEYSTTKLTIRDLLTHRTGLPRHDLAWYGSKMSKEELLKKIRFLQPTFELREKYHYGQLSYFVAGTAMEKITGKLWTNVIQERILTPLGMYNTNFSIEDMQKSNNYATPYIEKNDKLKSMPLRNLNLIGPAGSINSNVSDLTHWMIMQLAGGVHKGKSLISPTTLQELYAPQVIVPGVPESKETLLQAYGIGWLTLSYRGHYIVSHDGVSDGFTSVLGLLPNENIGIVILSNKNMTALPRYLYFTILDRILGLPQLNWLAEGVNNIKKNKESAREIKIKEDLQRRQNTVPSHPIEEYVGIYEHPGYGKVSIELVDGKLELHHNDLKFVLDHWHYDTFTIIQDKQDTVIPLEGTKISFSNHTNGDIGELHIPFEPTIDPIAFKRVPAERHGTLGYLSKFTGVYEIYGYTVEIAIKNHTLLAVIPGQSTYELVPCGENEFSVKSMTGATVRFIMDGDRVEEALMIYPYGAFSATPKR
jgi:CubicO group peptidase (beta-lactamase class C family)